MSIETITPREQELLAINKELLEALQRFVNYPGTVCNADFEIGRAAIACATKGEKV